MISLKQLFSKTKNVDLILSGNLLKALLLLAIPIVINSLMQSMYNLTDSYWLGKIGTNPMAAITLVSPVQNIVVNFGQGITVAGSILISQLIGARDVKSAKQMANQIFMCSMIFSVVCAALCFAATPSIVSWLGADGQVLDFGITYLQIVILDMPFLFMINIYTAVNQSQGNTVSPMLLNLAGVVINLILDPLFLIVFEWGVAGAALATLLAKIPCAAIALYSLTGKTNALRITPRGFRFDKEKIMKIIKIGLPTAIGGSTMQFGFLLMSRNVMVFGPLAVAAYGIGNRINSLITMPSNSMGSATSTIVGQNIGANQIDRADSAYKLARRIIVLFLIGAGFILSRPMVAAATVSIFSDDPQVIAWATDFLCILAVCCWTNGIYNTTTGLFQGSGHTMVLMVIDATRLWVFRFLTIWVCQNILNMGLESIWYSVVVSNGISAFILLILYKMKIWKRNTE